MLNAFIEAANHLLAVHWVYALSVAVAFYFALRFIEKAEHLNKDACAVLTLWLNGDYESTWSAQFCRLFDAVFTDKHFSVRCFVRSAVASLVAVLLLYVLFAEVLGTALKDRFAQEFETVSLWQALLLGAAINILPDYLSLFETRWLLQRFERITSFWGQCAMLVVDALLTGAVIWVGIAAYRAMVGEAPLTAVEMVALFSVFSVFFYSTFLTSVWAWVYCLSTWFVRLFSRTGLKRVLNIEEKPLGSIALVGAVVIGVSVFVLTSVLGETSERRISVWDEWLCERFPDTICEKVAERLTADEAEALVWLAKACEAGGDSQHCMDTANRYYEGDDNKAVALWRKACDGGDARGCTNLGFMYEKGQGVTQDDAQALSLYRQGCDGGHAGGCTNLGFMYDEGQGVTQDEAQALSLYRQGCDGGEARGCTNLGLMYATGQGVTQDDVQAVSWYRQGCDGGNAQGCSYLGDRYERGVGVMEDSQKARTFYERGCKAGDAWGCNRLERMQ